MALNDIFQILPKKQNFPKNDLISNQINKDYWENVCKENPSKQECLFYCD